MSTTEVNYQHGDSAAWTEVQSDSQPWNYYIVKFYPNATEGEDKFSCECPSYRFNNTGTCKHIQRVATKLTDAVDAAKPAFHTGGLVSNDQLRAPFEWSLSGDGGFSSTSNTFSVQGDKAAEPQYEVILNDGDPAAFGPEQVQWIIRSLRENDELIVARLS